MTNKAVTFKALTPEKHIDNLDYYEEALDFALADEGTINIAITGIYGSGKTSVLESYKNKETSSKTFEKSDYLHISLADFEQSNADKDNGKHDISDKVLEGKILNQLLHQVNTKKIPQSIFRLKRNISKWSVLLSTVFIILFIINLFLLWRFPRENLKTVFLIIFFAQLSCIIYFLVRLQLNKRIFKRLSIRSKNIESDIEIFEDSDSSYFDKYLDDVIYLFYNSGAKVIVFEDLDRFDNNLIFAKLKEINTLVNNRKNKNEKIKFIYMIKDDMFLSKDRTKFFDFILPIIPFINPSNSYDELKSLLEQQSVSNDGKKATLFELFNSKFLLKLSVYIDDMRLLKNIVNEFLIYHGRLNQITLNVNKLLAFIVYKNIFPNDFAKIQINRGFVYHLFNNKEAYIEHEKNKLTEEIKELNLRIKESKKEHLKSKNELYALFFDREEKYYDINIDGKTKKEFMNRSDFVEAIINSDYKVRGKLMGYSGKHDIDLTKEFEKIESYSEFNERLKAIEDKDNIGELREITQRKKEEQKKLFDKKLYTIISRKNIEEAERKHFAKTESNEDSTFQEIKRSPYFDLLVFLITGGYIDEDYHSYITYFHEKSLTVRDKEFLRTVYDSHDSEGFRYETKLNRITEIYNRLDTLDFMKKEVLNFDLFNYILTKKSLAYRSESLENLFTQIYQTNNTVFFMELYNQLEQKAKFEVLNQLNNYVPGLFEKIIRDENIVEKDKCEVIADALSIYAQNQLVVLENKQKTLKHFIQDSNMLLYQQREYNDYFMNNINYLRIKFTKVEFDRLGLELRNYIYEEDLYAINLENISSILTFIYGYENLQDITHKNYTLLSRENDSFLKEYIEKNINLYIEKYLMFSEEIILDEPSAVYTILNNDDIDDNNKIKYVNILDQERILLNKLETTNYYTQLVEGRNLVVNAENILLYFQFSEDKWTSELVDFVNLNQKDFEFFWPDNSDRFDEEFKKIFFKATVGEDNLDNVVYQIILNELKLNYPNGFTLNNLSDEKINILIEINIIKFSKENLIALRKDYPFAVINFASKHLSDYLQLMEETNYYRYEELLEVLNFYKNSTTDIQKSIIDVIFEPISIVKKSLNPYVLNYILENKIDITDLPYIIQYYNSYKKSTRKVIIQVVADNLDNVITNEIDLTKTILNKLLGDREIDIEDRRLLFSRNIQEFERKELKDNFEFLELESFIEVVNEHRRNAPFIINETNQNILRHLHARNLISSYKKQGNYYNVNSKQERNLI
ncbi:YobI family P-loop NTPase [Alkalibacterium gilvum]|uniref:YobI family P-loop NTPase n=1 Tax=Alkalibacterium gilvum TaxID=1130080 RepID=UPI003F915DEA